MNTKIERETGFGNYKFNTEQMAFCQTQINSSIISLTKLIIVWVQLSIVLNHQKYIKVSSIDDFDLLSSVMKGGIVTKGQIYQSPVKIQVFEDSEASSRDYCEYVYRVDVEYNPDRIPCNDTEQVKAVLSEDTCNGFFELCEIMIDDNYNELTEPNSVYNSESYEEANKRFALCFWSSQFSDRKLFMSRRKFQIELFNIDDGTIIARSQAFCLNQIFKTIGKRSLDQKVSTQAIIFNNLNLHSDVQMK